VDVDDGSGRDLSVSASVRADVGDPLKHTVALGNTPASGIFAGLHEEHERQKSCFLKIIISVKYLIFLFVTLYYY
jgi:hypothetical protein